ncbi:MAG: hypothetical protein WAR24_14865 [Candidatus Acidiferrales bacterium]
MNSDGLLQELRDDGLYSGRSKVVLADPFGSVSGRATVRVTHNSRSEAEVSIEEFEAPPEYDNNLVAFLNASPPRRQGDKTVVSIGVDFDDRLVTSFELDTDAGIFSASSGMLRTPVLWGFRPNETLSLVLRPYIQSTRQQDGEVLAYPPAGPFRESSSSEAKAVKPFAGARRCELHPVCCGWPRLRSAKGVDGRFVPLTVRNENARHEWIPVDADHPNRETSMSGPPVT